MTNHPIIWLSSTGLCIQALPDNQRPVACISLPAGTQASLEWHEELLIAEEYSSQGFGLLWDLQLGLFSQLQSPLSNEMQIKTLQLAIDQFSNNVWNKFEHSTVGVILYRGPIDLTSTFESEPAQQVDFENWLELMGVPSQEQREERPYYSHYCLDLAAEYLHRLAAHLPTATQSYIIVEIAPWLSALDEALMLSQERFGQIIPLAVGTKHPSMQLQAPVGICLPPLAETFHPRTKALEQLFQDLQQKNTPYRLIPEESITALWHGLDTLILPSAHISHTTKRKLQGFAAAGGTSIIHGEDLY
jgi:hypothetical protein